MKVLHTSDWHLGQSLFTKSRKDEHKAFLNWLLETIEQQDIDAIIVAGDVFDTGTPPSYAREMYNQFVVDLQQQQCVLVVLGGNHDAVSTLNESKQVLACLNTHVVANTKGELEHQVIALPDKQRNTGALLCAIPFIRAKDVLTSQAGETGQDKRQNLADAIKQHYDSVYALAVKMKQEQGLHVPIIATGHLTALGVSQSESVRDIYIGTLDGFDASGFPPADYIALGHIHRPQIVAKSQHIRYSGSPIALSFDELSTNKQVTLVEFEGEKCTAITPIDIPVFQSMAVIKGDLPHIEAEITRLKESAKRESVWLSIEIEAEDYLTDLQQRMQSLLEGTHFDLLQLKRLKNPKRQLLHREQQESLSELKPQDVFAKRLDMEMFDNEDAIARRNRLLQHFSLVLEQVQDKSHEQ